MRRNRPLAALLLALILAFPTIASADDDDRDDHDLARSLVERGEIKPLSEVLARATARHPGEVVSVELDEDDGRWVYEIEVVRTDGRKVEIEIDAATLAVAGDDD
jgi:uncharacterized membrane protein YkoI